VDCAAFLYLVSFESVSLVVCAYLLTLPLLLHKAGMFVEAVDGFPAALALVEAVHSAYESTQRRSTAERIRAELEWHFNVSGTHLCPTRSPSCHQPSLGRRFCRLVAPWPWPRFDSKLLARSAPESGGASIASQGGLAPLHHELS